MAKLEDGSKFIELSMGPQHPSTHGVLRLAVRLDGEVVVGCKADIGYLHRSFEKFVETWQYPQLAPFVDRNDYLAGRSTSTSTASPSSVCSTSRSLSERSTSG